MEHHEARSREQVSIGLLIHLWITPFMLRLHPAGYAQHERASTTARPERSGAKSKGAQKVLTPHLKKDLYILTFGDHDFL